MPVVVPSKTSGLTVFNASAPGGQPAGLMSSHLFQTQGHGRPRLADLFAIRVLERSHTVQIPMDTMKSQVTTTPFTIEPTVEKPSQAHWDAAERIEDFFRGNFNSNRESLDHLLKKWTNDVVSIDAGVLELVPEDSGKGWLSEIYTRDGATFTKNPDIHERLPQPGSPDPAFYQFGITSAFQRVDHDTAIKDLLKDGHLEFPNMGIQPTRGPIPFTRDQIVWTEENPQSNDVYGYGTVQKLAQLVEIIANQNFTNIKSFGGNEIPEGLMALLETGKDELDRFREYWKDEVRGQPHKMPIINKDAKFIPFRTMLRDMQFLEGQEWYNKLVWYTFGLSSSEIGDAGDVNRSTAREHSNLVWRRKTFPFLQLLGGDINSEILPFMEDYWAVNGELAWKWQPDNLQVELLEREIQEADLRSGVVTVNEIRKNRGLEPLLWGDLPLSLVESVSRQHPEWALEAWGLLAADEVPAASFDFFSSRPSNGKRPGGGGSRPRVALSDGGATHKQADEEEPADAKRPPGVADVVRGMEKQLRLTIDQGVEDVLSAVESDWPVREDQDLEQDAAPRPEGKAVIAPLDAILDRLNIRDALTTIVGAGIKESMEITIQQRVERLEKELNEQLGDDDPEVGFSLDVEDTFAYEHLEREAAAHMVTVEDNVKDDIRRILSGVADTNGNVTDATSSLRAAVPDISDNHARLVARTETGSAQRWSSQAVAESSDAIWGKEWRSARITGRTRPWHAEMHGVQVEKTEQFTVPSGWQGAPHYQSSDYPKQVYVVGADEPYNCLCDQREILRDDLTLESLSAMKGIVRKHPPDYTDCPGPRARQVMFCQAHPGEGLAAFLRRQAIGKSKAEQARAMGVSKQTLYTWLNAVSAA